MIGNRALLLPSDMHSGLAEGDHPTNAKLLGTRPQNHKQVMIAIGDMTTNLGAWIEVNLDALCNNAMMIAARAQVPLLPMLKADGYGLGGTHEALALERINPWGYGVATVNEGRQLRTAGIRRPIIVFTPIQRAEISELCALTLTPALGDPGVIRAWGSTGCAWHLQIDTGMGRAGIRWDEIGEHAELLNKYPPTGVFTHFYWADAEDDSRDEQERRFDQALAALPVRPKTIHAENSSAVEQRPNSRWSFVRPGIFLQGVAGSHTGNLMAEPVVSIRARIVELRTIPDGEALSFGATSHAKGQRRIATVPIGYGDGYRRTLSNCGIALLNGRRVTVAGRITMDMTTFDVTDCDASIGDVITLLGDDGDDAITVADLAQMSGVYPNELLVGLRLRLPRLHSSEITERHAQ